MKVLVVAPFYPSEEDVYAGAYIHTRVKAYQNNNLDIDVLIISKESDTYIYENIIVRKMTKNDAKKFLQESHYKKILCHFAFFRQLSLLIKHTNVPIIIWCHGFDVVSWKRRIFNYTFSRTPHFFYYITLNTLRRIYLWYFRVRFSERITFVFVSEWLKIVAERDLYSKGRIQKYHIIPNPVDTDFFSFKQKERDYRLKFLTIKSFASTTYANDITRDVILELSSKPYFNKLNFTIVGRGRLWDSITADLKGFENVTLINRFLDRDEIKEMHDKHGVMLMPSRQDSQGLSTCEGISSGLVAITSFNSGIPEYVDINQNYLCKTVKGFVDSVEELFFHPDRFVEKSKKANMLVKKKCTIEKVAHMELAIILDKNTEFFL